MPFAVCCSRPYIVYVNLPRQHIFRDSFLTRQTGAGEQCSPLQEFFDSLGRHALMPPGCVRLQQSARGVGDAAPYNTDVPDGRALTRIFTKNIDFP